MLDSSTRELQQFIEQDSPFSSDCFSFHTSPWRLPLLCLPEYSLELLLWELGRLRLNSLRLRGKLGL